MCCLNYDLSNILLLLKGLPSHQYRATRNQKVIKIQREYLFQILFFFFLQKIIFVLINTSSLHSIWGLEIIPETPLSLF